MAGAPQRPPQPAQPGGPDRRKAPAPAPAEAPAAGGEKPEGGRRGAMLPAIVVAVALLAAAFMLKGGGGGDDAAAVATTPTSAVEETGNPAHVVSLDPVTLNLADGSLAKVGIAIEVSEPTLLEEIGEEPANFGAKALDELIQLFGEHSADDLQGTGKAQIKDELTKRVGEAYHGEVVAVYFTELVIP